MVIAHLQSSDNLPIRNSLALPINLPDALNPASTNNWRVVTNWSKTDLLAFQCINDNILQKIKVPYQLLSEISCINDKENQVLLNIYYAEIMHALRVAEKQSVTARRMRVGTEKTGRSENSEQVEACRKSGGNRPTGNRGKEVEKKPDGNLILVSHVEFRWKASFRCFESGLFVHKKRFPEYSEETTS